MPGRSIVPAAHAVTTEFGGDDWLREKLLSNANTLLAT